MCARCPPCLSFRWGTYDVERTTVSVVVRLTAEQRLNLASHQVDSVLPLRAAGGSACLDPRLHHCDDQLADELGRKPGRHRIRAGRLAPEGLVDRVFVVEDDLEPPHADVRMLEGKSRLGLVEARVLGDAAGELADRFDRGREDIARLADGVE